MLAITFRNISELADVSDYEYRVIVGGKRRIYLIESGLVKGHSRSKGWETLVRKFLKKREVKRG